MQDSQRCPRGPDVVSYCRRVTCATASAGTRSGTSGTTIGKAYLQGAFSEAAVLCRRAKPAGQQYRSRLEQKPGKGTALTGLAPQLARAVYDRLQRTTAFARNKCWTGERSGARAPGAARATDGRSVGPRLCQPCPTASWNA